MAEEKQIPKTESRTISLDPETVRKCKDKDERSIDLAFSSEEPVVRGWGIEILDHSPRSMRKSRLRDGLPILLEHERKDLVGRLRNITIGEDRKARGTARFSSKSLAQDTVRDIEDGILTDVSVGYRVHYAEEMKTDRLSSDLMELAAREKLPVYRITDWEPYECSLVTVPADPTVGVGRTAEMAASEEEKVPEVIAVQIENELQDKKEERTMSEDKSKTLVEYEADMKAQTEKAAKDAKVAAEQRVSGIYELGKRFSNFVPGFLVQKAVEDGMPLDEFQRLVLSRVESGKPIDTPVSELGLSRNEIKRYSITRAILSQWKDSGIDSSFERACHSEIVKRMGQDPQKGGIFVPYDVMSQPAIPGGTRGRDEKRADLVAGTGSLGGFLVGTDNLGAEFIDLLRNQMLIRRLGARVLSGLRGNVTIPKRTAGVTSYWVGESTAPTEGANTFAQLTLSPKNVGANLDYTRNLLLQSNPSIDALVNGDLAQSLALAVDLAAFHGSGGAGQPQGIVGSSGVGSVTCTSIGTNTLSKIIEFQTDVASSNALAANCAYVTTPAVAGILKAQVLYASTASPAWEGGLLEGSMIGFRAFATNQISSGYMIFGDFSQCLIGEWSGLELVVDPYTQSKNGIIQVTAFQTIDVGVRYGGAFSVTTSVAT